MYNFPPQKNKKNQIKKWIEIEVFWVIVHKIKATGFFRRIISDSFFGLL